MAHEGKRHSFAASGNTSVSAAYQASVNNLIVKEKGQAMNFKNAAKNNTHLSGVVNTDKGHIVNLQDNVLKSSEQPTIETYLSKSGVTRGFSPDLADFLINDANDIINSSKENANDLQFKPLPSMQVNAAEISDYVQTLDTEKDKKGSFAGSSAALGASVEPHKKTHISVETKAAESAAITEDLEILAKDAEVKRVNGLSAMKQMGLSEWDTAPYVQDKELGTYENEEKMQTVYRPKEIEFEQTALLNKDNLKAELAEEKAAAEAAAAAEARAKQQAIQAAKRAEYIKSRTSKRRARLLAEAEAKKLAEEKAHSDQMHTLTYGRNEDLSLVKPGTETRWIDEISDNVVNEKGQSQGQLIVEKLEKERKEREKLAAVLDKQEKERRGTGFDTSGDAEGQRFANLPTDTSTLGMDADIRKAMADAPKGTVYPGDPNNKVEGDQLGRLELERKQRQLKADEHSRTQGLRHQGVGKETPFMTHTRKEASLAVQLAKHNMPMFMSDAEKQKMVSALDRIDEEKTGGDKEAGDQWKKWNNDPFRFSTFAYPRDVTTNMENGHYILFYVNVQNKTKYSYDGITETQHRVPVGDQIMTEEVKQRATGRFRDAATKKLTDFDVTKFVAGEQVEEFKEYTQQSWNEGASKVFDTNIDYQKRRVLVGHKGQILRSNQVDLMKGRKSYQGLDSVHKTTTRITDSVALYLPPGVSNNTSVTYSPDSLGMAGYMAFSFGDVVNKWKDRDFEGVADIMLDMGGTAIVEAMKTMGLGAFGAAMGADEGSMVGTFDKAFGQTHNPYIEVNFNSMGMRDFSYTFHFSPKSKEETLDVKAIINLFRFHMAPELKGTNHRYLTLPSTFDIHYMYQSTPEKAHENQFYNKIATCVLTGCNVDYTPNGVKSFSDGAPTQINMTLSFSETKMLTKQKISDGF